MTFLLHFLYLYVGGGHNSARCNMNTNQYRRQYRELSDETKEKISLSTTGVRKSDLHKQHISQAMKDYWKGVPHKPDDEMRKYLDGDI